MLSFVQSNQAGTNEWRFSHSPAPSGCCRTSPATHRFCIAALQRYKPQAQEFAVAGRPVTSAAAGILLSVQLCLPLDASTAPRNNRAIRSSPARVRVSRTDRQSAGRRWQPLLERRPAYAEDQRAVLSLNALNSLARILGGLPGRKNIIWVTGNLPFSLVPENRTMTDAELEETLPSLDTRRVGQHAGRTSSPCTTSARSTACSTSTCAWSRAPA